MWVLVMQRTSLNSALELDISNNPSDRFKTTALLQQTVYPLDFCTIFPLHLKL